jgi:hypothetical protein
MRAILARGRPHPDDDWTTPAMKPIIDPRDGDVEDDASSTKQR